MFEWSEEQLAIRDAVRRFVDEEIAPSWTTSSTRSAPYDVLRKLYATSASTAGAR